MSGRHLSGGAVQQALEVERAEFSWTEGGEGACGRLLRPGVLAIEVVDWLGGGSLQTQVHQLHQYLDAALESNRSDLISNRD